MTQQRQERAARLPEASEFAVLERETDGKLGRPVVGWQMLYAHHTWIDDDHVGWLGVELREVPEARSPLDEFIKLGEDSVRVEDVLGFCRRWGPLFLCQEHGLPLNHSLVTSLGLRMHHQRSTTCHNTLPTYLSEAHPIAGGREARTAWIHLAKQARHILLLAASLAGTHAGSTEQRTLLELLLPDCARDWGHQFKTDALTKSGLLQTSWEVVAFLVETWMKVGCARMACRPDPDGSVNLRMVSDNLVGLIGVQLYLAVNRADGLYVCFNCGEPFNPVMRRPSPGRRAFCPECRDRGRWKAAKADQRVNDRAADLRAESDLGPVDG